MTTNSSGTLVRAGSPHAIQPALFAGMPDAPRGVAHATAGSAKGGACVSCGLTWEQGCARPDWAWIDEGHIGMSKCWRCGGDVCHHCYARSDRSYDLLCPACFAIAKPPDDAECARHPYAHNGAAYVRNAIAWRYEAPTGQVCEIDPCTCWYWRVADSWNVAQPEREHRWRIIHGSEPATAADASWMPSWIPLMVAVKRRGGQGDEIEDEAESGADEGDDGFAVMDDDAGPIGA